MPTPARRRGGRVNAGQALALLLSLVLVSATGGVLLAGTVLPGVAVANGVTDLTSTAFDELPGSLEQQPLPEKSTILAADGTLLAEFYIRDRVVVPLSEIAEPMQKAVIATEDKRFYEHAGVDPQGMLRAAVRNAMSADVQEGASTLTQQYVKNVLIEEAMAKDSRAEQLKALQEAKDDEGAEGYARKLREAKYAITLEKQMTKDEILEKYLNIAQFGVSVYGVEAAANFYFSKHAKDLDFAEAALIAGVTRSPSRWDPSRNPKEAKDRRDTVLELMRQQGYITDAQFQEGSSRKVEDMLKISEPKLGCMNADANVKGSGYFCDYVTKIIRNDPAFGKTEDDRLKLLYRGGLTITTTLRPKEQTQAYKSVTKAIPVKDKSKLAAVLVTVEPGTGKITAMAQNRVYNNTSKSTSRETSVNYSTDFAYGGSQGFQPGSTFKPFTLLEWLKEGHSLTEYVNASKMSYPVNEFNAPCTNLVGEPYKFGNAEGGSTGNMSVLNATKNSVNSAYIRMASELNICKIFEGAAELGVQKAWAPQGKSLDVEVYPANLLGSANVAPLTMAAAYATFASNGTYCKPIAISKVVNKAGEDLGVPSADCHKAIESKYASAINYALSNVWTGTAKDLGSPGFPAAGKTGTTDQNKFTWFMGYTPKRASAVAVGNADLPTPMQGKVINGRWYSAVYGATIAGPIWFQYAQNTLGKSGDNPAFATPDDKQVNGDKQGVPQVIGMGVEQARATIEGAGFKMSVASERRSSNYPEGVIADQSPKNQAAKGGTIWVYLSSGGGDNGDGNNGDGNNGKGKGRGNDRPGRDTSDRICAVLPDAPICSNSD